MTAEKINQAIAGHVGWTRIQGERGMPPGQLGSIEGDAPLIPNYAGDLNAMHEAEKVIIADDDGVNEWSARYTLAGNIYRVVPTGKQPVFATAIQRAEAFLRTIGKWEETPP